MKSLKVLVLCCMFSVLMTSLAFPQAIRVSLPDNATGDTGTSVTIPIAVGDLTGRNIIAYQAVITFDEKVLDAIGASSAGTLAESFGPPTVNITTDGKITVGGFGISPLSGSGTLINLTFNVVGVPGAKTDMIFASFIFNAGDPPATLTNGKFTVREPDITINPISHDFGDVAVSSSASQTFSVSNQGTTNLVVNKMSLMGANADQFNIESGAPTFTLAPGETLKVVVSFKPTSVGTKSTALRFESNDPDESRLDAPLQGNGISLPVPDIDVKPNSHDYGNILINSSVSQAFMVSNVGTAILKVTSTRLIGINTDQFTFDTPVDTFTLVPGKSRNVAVNFKPTSEGSKRVTLRFESNDTDESLFDVLLTGGGIIPNITIFPDSLNFDDVPVGSSKSLSVLVRNTGSAILKVKPRLSTGADADQFIFVASIDSFMLAPGSSRNVAMSFKPTSAGLKRATLRFESNDPDEPALEMSLTGNGFFAKAQPFDRGDVFAGVANGRYQHYDGAGNLLETLVTGLDGYTTGMALDKTGNFYGTNFSVASVSRFTGPGIPHNHSVFFTTDPASLVESILFDAADNIYVGQASGTRDILKFDASGNFLARFDVATERIGSDWIDLAADQRTMFYTSEGKRILRYDVVANAQLADFNTVPLPGSEAYALRLLPGGGLLVADSELIVRVDAIGSVIQTYDVTGENNWFALNLDPDGTSFWSGNFDTGNFYKFDIATGSVLLGPFNTGTGPTTLFGLAVFGEITVARLSCQVKIISPTDGTIISGNSVAVKAITSISGGIPPYTMTCDVNGVPATVSDSMFTVTVSCADLLIATCIVVDSIGTRAVCRDTVRVVCGAPFRCEVQIASPQDGATVCNPVMVTGITRVIGGTPPFIMMCDVNGVAASVSDSIFTATVPCNPNLVVTCKITDAQNRTAVCRDSIRVVCVDDNIPPTCTFTSGYKSVTGTFFDNESGIAKIEALFLFNARLTVDPFTPGAKQVKFRLDDLGEQPYLGFDIKITDMCGNTHICDPVFLQLTADRANQPYVFKFRSIDRYFQLTNKGLTEVRVELNGKQFSFSTERRGGSIQSLGVYAMPREGEVTLDLQPYLRGSDDNEIRLEVTGPAGSSAELLLINEVHDDDGLLALQEVPLAYELSQNYPNPFNPETVIRFGIPASVTTGTSVQLRIYNTLGELVQTLVDQPMQPGSYTARWNGRNDRGDPVAAGVYIYRIVAGEYRATKRMLMLK